MSRNTQNRKARQIFFNVTTGVAMKGTDKLLRRLGFAMVGGIYSLGLKI